MNKEDKEFLEKNKEWIVMIILTILITNFEYINMFKNIILNGVINILFASVIMLLIYLFYKEEKNWIKKNTQFYRFLINTLLVLGIMNACYHIGYAVGQIVAII